MEKHTKRCSCGRVMHFAQVHKPGARPSTNVPTDPTIVPLDLTAPVYRIVRRDADGQLIVVRDTGAAVSHFKTCRDASLYGKGRKR